MLDALKARQKAQPNLENTLQDLRLVEDRALRALHHADLPRARQQMELLLKVRAWGRAWGRTLRRGLGQRQGHGQGRGQGQGQGWGRGRGWGWESGWEWVWEQGCG